MKIVHLMGYFMPEFGYQEYYLAKEHAKMGHDVHVIASDRLYPFKNIKKMFEDSGLRYYGRKRKAALSRIEGIKVHWLPRIIEDNGLILCRNLKQTLEKIRPDIVFAHESRQGLSCQAAFYKDALGFRLIVDQHDFYHKIKGRLKTILRYIEYYGFRKRLIDYNFRKAEKIIAVTEHTREFLMKAHKIPGKNIEVIELGVDTGLYCHRENTGALRKRLGIKKDEVVLMFVGTIYPRKNIEMLMEAYSELPSWDKARLLIVGEGDADYMEKLKAHSKRLEHSEKITFAGFAKRSELPSYYSMADVGVWPANNSVSIIEAMACRLPVVIVDWQMPHLVSHKNGFKFPFNDKKRLKECLEALISGKKLRLRMGKNSEKAANKLYSYRAIAKRFLGK